MNILDKIKAYKLNEVAEMKSLFPVKGLEKSIYFETPTVSLKKYITSPKRSGIIAEFKRKSPSKGDINKYANVEEVTLGYMQSGAAALSVLTDKTFFGAKDKDLQTARKFNYCPILKKDFIVDEYQIIEAKSTGADAILLIAKMLSVEQIKSLCSFAQSLDLEVLLETHTAEEIKIVEQVQPDLVGINNRNLQTFEVDIQNSIDLANLLPKESIKIAESGISNLENLRTLKSNGFDGFLIGEYFMKNSRPQDVCAAFINSI